MRTRFALVLGLGLLLSPEVSAQTPPTNWSGFYLGGNAGYGWGTMSASPFLNASNASYPDDPFFLRNPAMQVSDGQKASTDKPIWGGQLGYNFQSQRWIIGVEADLQQAKAKRSGTFPFGAEGGICNGAVIGSAPPPVCTSYFPASLSGAASFETSIDWFGTVRGRLGFLLADEWMIYFTGGLAYGRVGATGSATAAVNSVLNSTFGPASTLFSASKTNFGYTLGGGIEGKLSPSSNWSWKAEYLHIDLGSMVASGGFVLPVPAILALLATSYSGTAGVGVRFTENVLRFGLNYRLAP